jgi:ATP-dependent DNA ligase
MGYFPDDKINLHAPGAECIPAMKIWKLPDGKEYMFAELANSGDYFATIKKDGYWYMFEKTDDGVCYMFSRTTSKETGILSEKIANVPHLEAALNCLPNGSILIGEIYYPGKTSKDVTTIMGCLAPKAIQRQEELYGPIHYYVHDIIKYNGFDLKNEGAWTRFQVLQKVWEKHQLFNKSEYLEIAEPILDNIQEATAEALNNGEEGMVLKKKDVVYSPDKRPAWSSIKIKKMDYADVICIGVCDATKEYTGKEIETWPYWMDGVPVTKGYYYGWKTAIRIGAYNDKGELVEIGTVASGLTDELRENLKNFDDYYLRVCSVQCMEKDKQEHTLRHPFFKGFRDDKDPKDCTIDTIF